MNINLREAIFNRVQGKSTEELQEIISGSIGGKDQVLPGLGVLFEMIWEHSKPELHDQLVQELQESIASNGNGSAESQQAPML